MTIKEVCAYAACARSTCYKLLGAGDLEAVKIGARTLVTKRSVDALIERGLAAGQSLLKR